MAKVPKVEAVKKYVNDFTKFLSSFRKWNPDWVYEPLDPCFYNGNGYYANSDNPPQKGQDPEHFIDCWNLITGGAGGEAQTLRIRIKIARPGVKIVKIDDDLKLSPSVAYRVTPVLASNYPYFRNVFVERRGNEFWIYLYVDTEPYTYPHIGYLHGSTRGSNVKIGKKLVGTFYFGDGRVEDNTEYVPPKETELRIGDGLVVGEFVVGYIPLEDDLIVRVGSELLVGNFYIGEKVLEELPDEEISDDDLPGIFIDLFIQREV